MPEGTTRQEGVAAQGETSTVSDSQYEQVFQGINTVRRTQQVREQLLAAIGRGDFKPGDALPSERALAEIFDVSRVSVREAIRSLEAIGLLEVQHGRGCFVIDRQETRRTTSSWLDLYRNEALNLLEVRGAIDQMAAEAAATRAKPEALARVQEAHQRYLEGAADPATTLEQLVALDIAFHDSIGEASGNILTAHLLHDLNAHLNESRRESMTPSGRPQASGQEHAEILEAILARKPAEARISAARHVEAVRKIIEADSDDT